MKKHILIIEDQDHLRLIIKKFLENENYVLLEAPNGKKGLEILEQYKKIDLVLLDIMMPEMDGAEFLQKIKEQGINKNFKICMLTAKGLLEDVKKFLVSGADDYIIKPIDKNVLNEKVTNLIEGISSDEFFRLNADLKGTLFHPEGNEEINITKISELEICFSSSKQIPIGAKIQITSKALEKKLGRQEPLLLRVFETSVRDKFFNIKSTFIGLNEQLLAKLRSLALKGEDLYE